MRLTRTAVVAGVVSATAVVSFLLAAAASAHVTVSAPGATRGGSDQEITFRVPVEKDADTVGLKLQLPTSTPIASVDVEPTAGWTHTETMTKLPKPIVTDDGDITEAVREIDWTAQKGSGLKPGEFGAFTIIAGQLPDASSLTFRAIQLYSDGSQVAWNEVAAPGSKEEPQNPAPVLQLAAASGSTPSARGTAAVAPNAVAADDSGKASSGAATTGIVLGAIGALLGLIAVGVALRGRRPARS